MIKIKINKKMIKEYWSDEEFRLRFFQGLGLFILTILFLWWVSIPKPEKIWSVNVEAQSAFVTWVTKKPRKGCVVAIKLEKPREVKKFCDKSKEIAHLLKLEGLQSETIYSLVHIDQLRITLTNFKPIATKPIRERVPLMPEPAYGSVVNESGEPIANTVVYVFPVTSEYFYPVATKTNDQGNYAVDLSEIIKKSNKLNLWAISSKGELLKIIVDSIAHTPFPSIIEKN